MNAFRRRLLDVAVDAIVWGAVLMTAYGAGEFLEAVVDTVRYGHPR
jgi:hypothetical protein